MLTSKKGTCTTKTGMGSLDASGGISFTLESMNHIHLTKRWTMELSKNVDLEEARHVKGAEPHGF